MRSVVGPESPPDSCCAEGASARLFRAAWILEALGLPAVTEGQDELVGALVGVHGGGGVEVVPQPHVQPPLVRIATAPREPAVGLLEQLHGLHHVHPGARQQARPGLR